jgi:hypothetical protein
MGLALDSIIPNFSTVYSPITRAPFVEISWKVSCRCIDENGKAFKNVSGTATAISKFGLIIAFEKGTDTPSTILVSIVSGKNKKIGVKCKVIYTENDNKGNYFSLVKYEAPEESSIKFIRAVITSYNLAKCRAELKNEDGTI